MAGEAYTPGFTGVAPAGVHTDGHRANARRFSTIIAQGYTWVRKQLPGPGAMNYAFDTLSLAESSPIGPGVRQRQFWNKLPTPLFVPSPTAPMAGLGGVVHGQTISQPLFDPYSNVYGNIKGPVNG